MKSLTATLTYFKSLIATLSVFWAPEFGRLNRYTGLLNGLDTSLTNYSSSTSFLKAHHRTSLGTLSRAFSKSTNAKYKFHFFFAKYFSCNCLKIKMAFMVPHPSIEPNCISSMSTCCLINF